MVRWSQPSYFWNLNKRVDCGLGIPAHVANVFDNGARYAIGRPILGLENEARILAWRLERCIAIHLHAKADHAGVLERVIFFEHVLGEWRDTDHHRAKVLCELLYLLGHRGRIVNGNLLGGLLAGELA